MKKLVVLLFAIAGLSAFAGTCVIRNDGRMEVDGDLVYGAEMFNDTGVDILQHRFLVGFLDDDGEVINTKNATQCTRTLQAGASNYYSADSTVDPDDVGPVLSRMVIDSGLKLGQALENDITIESNVEAVRDDEEIRVTGTVTNDGNDDYQDVVVCAVVFNNDDDVVVVALETEFDLDADDDQNFSITIPVSDDEDDAEYVNVLVDAKNADESDKLTEPVIEDDIQIEDCDSPAATATGTLTATNTATATSTPVTPTATATPDASDCN